METVPAEGELNNALAGVREVSGRAAVLGMTAFALAIVAAMFTYWELYTRPFRPLQAAIAARFERSSPRVVGGRYKSHRPDSPAILRIIIRSPLDPREHAAEMRSMANELIAIAAEHGALEDYDRVEVFIMHRRPEQWTITWSVAAPRTAFPLPVDGALDDSVTVRVTEGVEGS